jgi:hypothetical protein
LIHHYLTAARSHEVQSHVVALFVCILYIFVL